MGAGQIGGIATLLNIDFENAAGFIGTKAETFEAQYIVYYFSASMFFCMGALIEPHVVLTPAMCVYGEDNQFEVFGGTHKFRHSTGVSRVVEHVCFHRGYNHSIRFSDCSKDNVALMVLNRQFSFRSREAGGEYTIQRIRYGYPPYGPTEKVQETRAIRCAIYGWGSRRNGFLVPLLIELQKVEVTLTSSKKCYDIWDTEENNFLCVEPFQCRSERFGALCPDDVGSILECDRYAKGMMVSRLVDRPCGVGFLDLSKYKKFMECGVDDSQNLIDFKENGYTWNSQGITESLNQKLEVTTLRKSDRNEPSMGVSSPYTSDNLFNLSTFTSTGP